MTAKPPGLAAAGAKRQVCTYYNVEALKTYLAVSGLCTGGKNKNCDINGECCVRHLSEKLSKHGTKSRRRVPEEFWSGRFSIGLL